MKPFLGIILEACLCLVIILAGYLFALGVNFLFLIRV